MTVSYPIQVRWSAEDSAWIADVPDLPYCTADGPTRHEAVAQVELAIEAWLQAARAEGRPIPEPSSRLNVLGGEGPVTTADLDRSAETSSDLSDPDVMRHAWE